MFFIKTSFYNNYSYNYITDSISMKNIPKSDWMIKLFCHNMTIRFVSI